MCNSIGTLANPGNANPLEAIELCSRQVGCLGCLLHITKLLIGSIARITIPKKHKRITPNFIILLGQCCLLNDLLHSACALRVLYRLTTSPRTLAGLLNYGAPQGGSYCHQPIALHCSLNLGRYSHRCLWTAQKPPVKRTSPAVSPCRLLIQCQNLHTVSLYTFPQGL